ncbi:hypothetical protein EU803_12985 [Loktanella sp. IMCC34160]|uniref:hypothetical protein n=1 Tax=Loktanella sp. IMCC34160 TaxID=2510646 RepID=UPI00101E0526|nr:hypothetical protein [Loktanella sp. IMCC34160]RYG90899.1 hypothetical protein EU803_12985 [Loktanella sp. IMCC34160]
MIRATLAALLLFGVPAAAQTALTAEEFEAISEGETFYFGVEGDGIYGMETYYPDRRVIWTFLDGRCEEGIWYDDAGNICFSYGFDPEPQCWRMFKVDEGLMAVFMNRPESDTLYTVTPAPNAVVCQGPGV